MNQRRYRRVGVATNNTGIGCYHREVDRLHSLKNPNFTLIAEQNMHHYRDTLLSSIYIEAKHELEKRSTSKASSGHYQTKHLLKTVVQ
jgi:hypothetical protein